jgi:CBS domain-containing protein
MPRSETSREDLKRRVNDLRTLRDQIRLDLHLASMELRDEWRDIERKLPDPDAALQQVKGATTDALEALTGELRRFRARLQDGDRRRVADVMTRDPAICAPTDSVAQALATMWSRDVGCLPVVDGNERLVGMITDRDTAVAACTRGQRMDDIPVQSVMSTKVVGCTQDSGFDEALALMRGRQVRRLPVLSKDGKVEGLVTLNDIARAVDRVAGSRPGQAGAQLVVATLVAIARPPEADTGDIN